MSLVDGAGMYDVLDVSGSGLVTEHVAGMGTMAGPPARLTESLFAGRALESVEIVATMSRLVVVDSIISVYGVLRSVQRLGCLTIARWEVRIMRVLFALCPIPFESTPQYIYQRACYPVSR